MKKAPAHYFLTLLAILAFTVCSVAQTAKHRVLTIPVTQNGINMHQPFTGGLNSPQFSAINLNNDGLDDLFVFDRIGDKVLTYINTGNTAPNTYTYAPQYEKLFPDSLIFFAFIRDYNHDNVPDIFSFISTGVRVYKGSISNNLLHFEIVSNLLLYNDAGFKTNIYVRNGDNAEFIDVNHDGDIDVLTPNGLSGSTVEYYENQTIEHAGNGHYNVDSFQYELVEVCWGGFSEAQGHSVNIGACKGAGGQPVYDDPARDLGTTVAGFDYGNDGDIDLLTGQISFNNIMFVENCGDSSYSHICAYDSVFPKCNVGGAIASFPAAYSTDIDNDGLADVLISPNARTGARDTKNVMLYKQTTNSACPFQFVSDSFLVEQMLDLGTESKPFFVDVSGDGLTDIVIGSYGYYRPFQTYKSGLAYLENTGTATQPSYTFRSDDLYNISAKQLIGVHPAFGDLNGDGKKDLLIGEQNGYLYFAKNTGITTFEYSINDSVAFFGIDAGQFSAPFIYDVNNDQLNDIIVGRKDGKLSYYWNMGTATAPLFNKDSVNNNFGQVNVTQPGGYTDGSSTPFITLEDNKLILYVGCTRGLVLKYEIDTTKLRGGSFLLLSENCMGYDAGSKAVVSIADINNDGYREYIIGNASGGLLLYSDSVWNPDTELSITNAGDINHLQLLIYPNPANNRFVCVINDITDTNTTADMFDLYCRKVTPGVSIYENQIRFNTTEIASGMYYIRIVTAGKTYTGKVFIKQ